MIKRKVYIVCGPTASGKSLRALNLAKEFGGVIINADSQQVYRELPILTACPSVDDYNEVQHKMYQYVDGTFKMNANIWVKDAVKEIEECFENNLMPIVVGGTGFYIKALTEGLSVIPEIAPKIKELVRKESLHMKNEDLFKILQKYDKDLAAKVDPNNRQRVIRGIEVFRGTGTCLSDWQRQPKIKPMSDVEFDFKFIDFEMPVLEERIKLRAEKMIDMGAICEVENLLSLNYVDDAPVFKVIGVETIKKHINGEITKSEMVKEITLLSRQYAKRQRTFFKTQFKK